MGQTQDWTTALSARENALIALRRDFHRHPELSFQEKRTADIVVQRLRSAGLEVRSGVGGTGVVGILRGSKPGRTIAWRADMDALPLTEKVEGPFASVNPGVMHACGHDGHTAIGVILAETLAAQRVNLPGTAVFLFQPAEEIGSGARAMIAAGALENPHVESIFGLHLITKINPDQIAFRKGPFFAAADSFTIQVKGKGGHGALPHQTIDPIPVAAHIVLGLENLIAREVSAKEPAVLTIGQITAGTKHNIIPSLAEMQGTLRTVNPKIRTHLKERLPACVSHLAQAYRAEAETTFHDDGIPAVVNDARHTELVRKVAAEELGMEAIGAGEIAMTSDDMALFLAERGGCYFLAGIGESPAPEKRHHSPEFQMNERGLMPALKIAFAVMRSALGD